MRHYFPKAELIRDGRPPLPVQLKQVKWSIHFAESFLTTMADMPSELYSYSSIESLAHLAS